MTKGNKQQKTAKQKEYESQSSISQESHEGFVKPIPRDFDLMDDVVGQMVTTKKMYSYFNPGICDDDLRKMESEDTIKFKNVKFRSLWIISLRGKSNT